MKMQKLATHQTFISLAGCLTWCAIAGATCLLVGVANVRAVAPVDRPLENTGTGFFVRDGEVYDSNGFPFRIRGVNHTHAFGNQSHNTAAIPEIAKSNANSVRLVFFGSGTGITLTAAQQRDRVIDYVNRGIVPVVELHDYTGGNDATNGQAIVQAVDYWLEPNRKAYLQEFEDKLILNIANEWGPNSIVWRDAYIAGVQRLRDAGVNNLVMIDAGGNFGQNPNSIKNYGWDILNSDPQKNILFSQHMYGFWFTSQSVPGWAFSVRDQLTAIKNLGLPIVVGEFGWEDHAEVSYDTSDAMQIFEDLDVGWMAWAWYRGANTGDVLSLIKNVNGSHAYQYNTDADLTAYGNLVVNHPDFGLIAAARKASVYWAPGDFNGDGLVNGRDFLTWQRGESFEPLSPEDLTAWQVNYGSAGLIPTLTVPEPTCALLAFLCLLRVTVR